jgi:hypothetical protein
MTWHVEWTLFTCIAFTLITAAYRYTSDIQDQLITYGFSLIFWIAALGMWIYDQTGAIRLFGVLPHFAGLTASFAWFMQTLGEYIDRIGYESGYGHE